MIYLTCNIILVFKRFEVGKCLISNSLKIFLITGILILIVWVFIYLRKLMIVSYFLTF